ncbi:MAG: phosphomannomutase/phosphoglucomutase [Clostridia bacterium]
MKFKDFKSGTDIRGVASSGVEGQKITLTSKAVKAIANGFLLWCEETTNKKASQLTLAIGHDSRISANRISKALLEVFTESGATVYDCGLASTPSMFMAVLELNCDASVQITASHHPFNRNGLKFFNKDGGLDSPDISYILEKAEQGKAPKPYHGGEVIKSDFMKKYAQNLCEMIKKDVNAENYDLPLADFNIIVDAGNGAGGFYATDVLAKLGADTTGSQFLEPDGTFPNHVPNPEDIQAMESVCKATIDAKADLGVIFDTDVDRGGAVGSDGSEINRNTLVAIASAIALEGNEGGTIVTDSITSDGLKIFIEETLKGKHHRFKRGYKNVINEAIALNDKGINCPLAIETSGHAAMRENYFLDDGAYLVTKIIIKMAQLKKEGKNLNELLKDLQHAKEEKELRFPITTNEFRPIGENVIEKLEAFAVEKGYEIADDNREGTRISFNKDCGDGWLLLRLSVHDPIMPLNIESNQVGGVKIIAEKLKEFFEINNFENLDISALNKFLG